MRRLREASEAAKRRERLAALLRLLHEGQQVMFDRDHWPIRSADMVELMRQRGRIEEPCDALEQALSLLNETLTAFEENYELSDLLERIGAFIGPQD